MTIRNKLIVMLTVPLVALALVALFGFRNQSAQAEQNEEAQKVAVAIVGLDDLALRVAAERLAVMSGDAEDIIAERISATDTAVAALAAGNGEVARPAATEILQILGRSTRGTLTDEALEDYARALDVVDNATAQQTLAGFSADAVIAVKAVQSAREVADAQEEAWLNFFLLESAEPADLARLSNEFDHVDRSSTLAANEILNNGSRPFERPSSSPSAISLSQFRALAEEDLLQNTVDQIEEDTVLELLKENRTEWTEASEATTDFIANDARQRGEEIDSLRSLFTLLAVLGGLLLFTLIYVIGRSIVGPLNRLIGHADHMTQERLPFAVAKLRTLGASDELPAIRPIPKETDDEIGSLVDAFNEVQETAVKVATDQARSRRNVAEMFVSLGRRNQQLNHRMLNLISELERDERDPELLSGLYQLDHLATRMRRNAESLLVLAGNRSPRQWSRPVSLEDLVRSALAEVELFERIEIGELPEMFVHGNVVTDVTHLLAELLDNATQFSEPSTIVSISAQETLEGVEIEVFDEGFGIGEDDLLGLNERITNPPALDEAPSRLLGLFVVGRLAEQHKIDVHLESQPGVGTVATVALPSIMFPDEIPEDLLARDIPEVATAVPVIEIADTGDLHADLAGLTALTTGEMDVDASEGIPAWNPAAVHDEVLADATVPTIDEMMEALPTFPGVTIDNPDEVEVVNEIEATWPLARLDDEVATDDEPVEPRLTVLQPLPERRPAAEPLINELYAPGEEHDEAAPAAEPFVEHPTEQVAVFSAEPADEHPVEPLVEAELFEPTELFNPDQPIAIATFDEPELAVDPFPEVQYAPEAQSVVHQQPLDEPVVLDEPEVLDEAEVLEEAQSTSPAVASALPAPPIMSRSEVDEPRAAEESMAEPEMPTSFGGLPTRSPQATLEAAPDSAPALVPLDSATAHATNEKSAPAAPSAFSAFVSGARRGINDITNEPKPKFSSEGESE